MSTLVFQIPIYIAWLVGVILAVVNWKKHAKVSLLAVIAMVLLFIQSVAGSVLSVWLPMNLMKQGVPSARIGMLMAINSAVGMLIHLIVWVLILIAIFGWRKAQEPQR